MTKIKVIKVAFFAILSIGLFFSFAAIPAQANGITGVLDSSTHSDVSDICETDETLVFFTDEQYCLEILDFDGLTLWAETLDECDSLDPELCNCEDGILCEWPKLLQPIDCDETPSHWKCSCKDDVMCLPPIYWPVPDPDCDDTPRSFECMEKECEENSLSPECICRHATCLPESEAIFTWLKDPGWVDPPQVLLIQQSTQNELESTIILDVIENMTNSDPDEDFVLNYADPNVAIVIMTPAASPEWGRSSEDIIGSALVIGNIPNASDILKYAEGFVISPSATTTE